MKSLDVNHEQDYAKNNPAVNFFIQQRGETA